MSEAWNIRFGTAGTSDSFAAQGYKSSLDVPEYTAKMGLNAFEYQCGRGVRLGLDKAARMAALAAERDILFSVHAPYYISMSSLEEDKRLNSIQYLLQSAAVCRALGGRRIIFHSGSCGKQSREAALEKALPGLLAVQCDVASRASCEVAFHTVEQAVGHVDVLVSNAGIAQQKLFTDITPEEWQHMLDVNLSGAFHLCQLALPGMIRRKAGRILTVSSMWGQTGGSCEVHYSAAKAGLIGLTKALAKEEGPSGITVNCVAPGVIETDMMAAFTAEDKAALAEETPVGRLGTPEEVAKLLVFLAGEDAGYITGQVFGVNGGLVI